MPTTIGVPVRGIPDRGIPDRALPLGEFEEEPEPEPGAAVYQARAVCTHVTVQRTYARGRENAAVIVRPDMLSVENMHLNR
jgi:hypothetical protein